MTGFPAVFDTDWCGDYKLDETKIQGVEISASATYLWDGLSIPEGSTIRLFYICPECGKLVQFLNDTKRGDAVHCPSCLHRKVLE
jgi:DNA-directed RNA polymerase subunit RPC12/RpoP